MFGRSISYLNNILYAETEVIDSTLGAGWVMDFDSTQPINPTVEAVVGLGDFYDQVLDFAGEQLANGTAELPNLSFMSSGLHLQLFASEPINWDWVINFVSDMIDNLGRGFAALFKGMAYNDFWEIGAITTVLSTV